MKKSIPDWLIICTWRALLGEIYPSIRAIAILLEEDCNLTIKYYLDREPIDYDFESIEVVATNISSSVGRELVRHIDVDCCYTVDSIGKLDDLDGFIYCRREYDLD